MLVVVLIYFGMFPEWRERAWQSTLLAGGVYCVIAWTALLACDLALSKLGWRNIPTAARNWVGASATPFVGLFGTIPLVVGERPLPISFGVPLVIAAFLMRLAFSPKPAT